MNKKPKTNSEGERPATINRQPTATDHPAVQSLSVSLDPGKADPAAILNMQRVLGNKTVQRYLDARAKNHSFKPFLTRVDAGATLRNGQPPPVQRMYMPPKDEEAMGGDYCQVPTIGDILDSLGYNANQQNQQNHNATVLPETTVTGTTQRPTLYQGSTGPYVELLQNKLRGAGKNVQVDGVFGSDTKAKVKQFQEVMKLDADGVVGRPT